VIFDVSIDHRAVADRSTVWRAQWRIARPVFAGEPLRVMLPLARRRRRLTPPMTERPETTSNGRGSDRVDWLLAAATVTDLFAGCDDARSSASAGRVESPPVPTNVFPD
jgi:hypothetical protein